MNKKILIISIIIFPVLLLCVGLNYSDRFNNIVFLKIVNPYNPLHNKNTITRQGKADSIDYWQDPRGLFPIIAYNTPDSTKDLSASLKIMEKGGINIIINANLSWMPDPNKIKSAFERLGNTNLRWLAILVNECRDDFVYKNSNDETNAQIKKYLRVFNDNYVYGWYLWDEPGENRKSCSPFSLISNDDNADINRMVKQIRSDSLFNKKLDFVNLFPTYWDGTPNTEAYGKYIDAFISSQEFKPRVLCFDNYPLLKSEFGGFRRDYYSNLDIIRKKSIEYNIPFWITVLSSEHLQYKSPTFEEISLQIYSALAYGAKGIGYYLYSKSWKKLGYKSWILENGVDNYNVSDSVHGPLFLPVEKLNAQIQTLGKTLLKLEPVEVVHSSDFPNKQKDIPESLLSNDYPNKFIKKIINVNNSNADPNVLVGVLKARNPNEGKGICLLVVNKNVISKIDVGIQMYSAAKIFKYEKENGNKIYIKEGDTINTTVLAGSGELFYVE